MTDETTTEPIAGTNVTLSKKEREALINALAFGHGASGGLFGLSLREFGRLKAKLAL